jgi:hypothetical protein
MKLKFAEPDSTKYDEPISDREDLSREEVIRLAMDTYAWKESKCVSWYKLQIPQLGGNSPMELVQRGQTGKLVSFLRKKLDEREKNETILAKKSRGEE